MIQSLIATSFTGVYIPPPPPPTFVANSYTPLQGSTITFNISGITGVSEGTFLYWWIDGTSPSYNRANQFVENIDNSVLQIYTDGSGTLGGTFTLTPNTGGISFNIYIGYSLYSGFLNLSSDIFVTTLSNNFTVEWWQKMTSSVSSYDRLFDVGDNPNESIGFSEELQGNRLITWTSGVIDAIGHDITSLYNTWVHFAIVRNNNIVELYKNGTRLFYTSSNRLIEDNTSNLQIGGGSNQKFNGYLTNFHFMKDIAKYNGSFTPSTTPLSSNAETKLLLSTTSSNTTFIDSTGNHTASIIGGTWSSQSPFMTAGVQGALEFGGVDSIFGSITYQNSNLSITGNFTLELFFSKYTTNNYDGLISIGHENQADIVVQFSNTNNLWGKIGGDITDFGAIDAIDAPIFNWHHLVIQNDTNIVSLLLDGVVLATQSWIDPVNIHYDNSFIVGTGITNVSSMDIQPDGKILIVGDFTTYDGTTVNRIIRLNSDGSKDNSFVTGTGFNDSVYKIILQSDGKILVLGHWGLYYQGVSVNGLVRLNSDGSIDNSLSTGTFNNSALCMAIQSDGKILVGGGFTTYNSILQNKIIRLNSDGSKDSTFVTGTGFNINISSSVNSISIQPDGKILVGGYFTSYNGTTANRIIRLNTDGSVDNTFVTGTGFNSTPYYMTIQSDGKILVGGGFTSYNGTTANRIIRLNSDGSKDSTFVTETGFNSDTNYITIQPDGKILVGGDFISYNGTTANKIIRLNSDGSLDNTFVTGTGLGRQNANNFWVNSILVDSNDSILVGGYFYSYQGINAQSLIRLSENPNTGNTINIGRGLLGNKGLLHGVVTNVRFSNNVRYSTYTRPIEPFTSDSNTLLLVKNSTDNDKYLDEGIYSITPWNRTPDLLDSPRWIYDTNPFKQPIGGSIYFDGVSTYLNFPGSDDWAIDKPYELSLTFDNIVNVNFINNPSSASDWNTLFNLPNLGKSFDSVQINGNVVTLIGGRNIELNSGLNGNTNLLSVVDTGCITSLGVSCFTNCTSVTTFDLPMLTITPNSSNNNGCFGNCTSVTNFNLPKLITAGDYTFQSCSALTNLNLPNLITAGNYCFISLSILSNLNVPLLESIGNGGFQDVANIGTLGALTLNLPSLISMGDNALYGMNKLTTINIPSLVNLGTTTGYDGVFDNMFNTGERTLSITLPATLINDGDLTNLSQNHPMVIVTLLNAK